MIQVNGDTIVGMVPDKEHPTNKGIQCIKGLNANEPIYKDRLEYALIRKDPSDPLTGHVSATKGRFDESVFRRASYEEAEEFVIKTNKGKRIIPTITFPDSTFLVEPSNAELAAKLGLKTTASRSHYDLIVLGGGPAGLTAALYTAREFIDTLVIERAEALWDRVMAPGAGGS